MRVLKGCLLRGKAVGGVLLFLCVISLTFAGCSAQPQAEETSVSAASSSAVQTTAPAEKTYAVTQKTLSFQNSENGNRIYGQMYLPGGLSGRLPAVILSHSYMLNHTSMDAYCRALAAQGWAAYCFDFCGGSMQSESDGSMLRMTIYTEEADLESVLDGVRSLDYVDSRRVFLLGTSQGGLVSAMAAAKRAEQVRALILLYPAFNIPEMVSAYTQSDALDGVMGGMMSGMMDAFAGDYIESAAGLDVWGAIEAYTGDVLILHGTADTTVPISYSEKALTVYRSAELKKIEGANHGFNADNMAPGDYDDEVVPYITDFIRAHL